MVASLLRGQFAWRPLYGGQLSRGQFAAVSCTCLGPVHLSATFIGLAVGV